MGSNIHASFLRRRAVRYRRPDPALTTSLELSVQDTEELPRGQQVPVGRSVTRVPPTVRGLSLVSLFNDFASEMVYPLLPAFVTGTLGGGAALLGILDGAADLTSAMLKVVSG